MTTDAFMQLLGVRRPGAALVRGGLAPLLSQAFNQPKAEIAQVGPKRRQAGALQRVESLLRLFVVCWAYAERAMQTFVRTAPVVHKFLHSLRSAWAGIPSSIGKWNYQGSGATDRQK